MTCGGSGALDDYVDVVKALLEVGRRELVMLTADDGVSFLCTSGENGHLDVVKVGCASWC